jgi:hypothetical protein
MDGHGWQDHFDFPGELGCIPSLVGFILFIATATILKRFLFG